MSWLVDNAKVAYLLLGIIAAGLVAVWWLNKRAKFLGFAAGVVALIGLVGLLTHYYVSDSKQLENNVHAMAQAVKDDKVDDLFKHVSKDFRYKGIDRETLYTNVKRAMQVHKVQNVTVSAFRVEELSHEKKSAKTSFRVFATAHGDMLFRTEADFVLEGDRWKLVTLQFYNPVVDQNQEVDLPGLR